MLTSANHALRIARRSNGSARFDDDIKPNKQSVSNKRELHQYVQVFVGTAAPDSASFVERNKASPQCGCGFDVIRGARQVRLSKERAMVGWPVFNRPNGRRTLPVDTSQ